MKWFIGILSILTLCITLTAFSRILEMPTELKFNDPNYNIELIRKSAKITFPTNKVLADLAAAQAILESNLQGKPSSLAYNYNNLFGITDKSGTNGIITIPSKEYYNGFYHPTIRHFSSNLSLVDSFKQYKKLMELERYKAVTKATTFDEAAVKVQQCGYATDPHYAHLLIVIYEKYLKGGI